MKKRREKAAAIRVLAALFCCALLAGCGGKTAEEQVSVYSFYGENERFALSNGVLVLNGAEDVLYGGGLREKQEPLPDIAAYSMTFYVTDEAGEKTVLLSNSAADMTGGTVTLSGDVGQISGDVFRETGPEDLTNGLFLELNMTDRDGVRTDYQLTMTVTEVTGGAER